MTQPDSGELRHECRCGYHIVGRDAEGAHTWSECKPDSGEREVCGVVFNGLSGKRYSCNLEAGHVGPHVRVDPLGQRCAPDSVSLPLSLAQRILAMLEDSLYGRPIGYPKAEAMRDELRAIVERKT